MDNLTAAILTLVIVSPSIVVLAVLIWRQLLEFWSWMQPVRSLALTLVRQLSSVEIPLQRYLYAFCQTPPASNDRLKVIEHPIRTGNRSLAQRQGVIY